MKTRNIIAILAALPIVAGMTGCKSDEELEAKPANEILIVEGGNIEMRSGDESKEVPVTANCAWEMSYDATEWNTLTVQPQKGKGNGTLVITSDQNTTVFDRVDTITLESDGGLKQKITLRQVSGDPSINISDKALKFSSNHEGAQLLSIKSNVEGWKLEIPGGVDWLHVDKTSGSVGASVVNVSVDPTTTDVPRSTSFSILYGMSVADVLVTQEGMASDDITLEVNTDKLAMGGDGDTTVVHVTSNAEWRAFIPSSAQSWLDIEPARGVGNADVKVFCKANPSDEVERLSVIVFVAGTLSPKQADVLVQQAIGGHDVPPVQTPVLSDIEALGNHIFPTEAMIFFEFTSPAEVGTYGFCYSSTKQLPTISDTVQEMGSGGTGGFVEGHVVNLTPQTTYYARGFVRMGGQVFYTPNVVTFTTPAETVEPSDDDNPNPDLSRQM